MSRELLLEMQNVYKTFGGVQALKGVSLRVHAGETLGLVGENGAGKSTLMRILSGVIEADTDHGRIIVGEEEVEFKCPADAQLHGIAMIPQELLLIDQLTVAENIYLGREPVKGFGTIDIAKRGQLTREILDSIGCRHIDPDFRVRRLSKGDQQLVAIARRLVQGGRVFIMDEPTAALTESEAQSLFRIVKEQICPRGYAVVFISHRLEEVLAISDRVVVLRDGDKVADIDNVRELSKDQLIEHMVGKAVDEEYPKIDSSPGEIVLDVRRLSYRTNQAGVVNELSLAVRGGEVVGVTGLAGVGKTELGQVIIGLRPPEGGTVSFKGKNITGFSREDTAGVGIGYVSEDRRGEGLVLNLSSLHNMTLSSLDLFRRGKFFLDHAKERETASKVAERMVMKPHYIAMDTGQLSGGNQQKVVIIRQLLRDADLIVFDEPTKGIDVGAKSEIARIIGEFAAAGKGILLLSSEPREVLELSDQLFILTREEVLGPFVRGSLDYEKLMALELGATRVEGVR
jgi:ABC-type sugar transport system ATPase subunit